MKAVRFGRAAFFCRLRANVRCALPGRVARGAADQVSYASIACRRRGGAAGVDLNPLSILWWRSAGFLGGDQDPDNDGGGSGGGAGCGCLIVGFTIAVVLIMVILSQ